MKLLNKISVTLMAVYICAAPSTFAISQASTSPPGAISCEYKDAEFSDEVSNCVAACAGQPTPELLLQCQYGCTKIGVGDYCHKCCETQGLDDYDRCFRHCTF